MIKHSKKRTYVNPEANNTTKLPSQLVDTNKTTTDRRGRHLRDIDRAEVGASTNTNTCQNSSTVDETESAIAIGAQHETSTEEEDQSRGHQTPSAAEEVAGWVCEESAEKGTGLVQRDNIRADQVGIQALPVELILEGLQTESRADERAVIPDHA